MIFGPPELQDHKRLVPQSILYYLLDNSIKNALKGTKKQKYSTEVKLNDSSLCKVWVIVSRQLSIE